MTDRDLFDREQPQDAECPAQPSGSPPAAFSTRAGRRAAYDAWNASGRPWPPPAGLTSASLGALIKPRRERRW